MFKLIHNIMTVDTDAYLAKCVEDYYGVDTDTVEDHECEFCEETAA